MRRMDVPTGLFICWTADRRVRRVGEVCGSQLRGCSIS